MSGLVGYNSSDEEDLSSSAGLQPPRSTVQELSKQEITETHIRGTGSTANPVSNRSIVPDETASTDRAGDQLVAQENDSRNSSASAELRSSNEENKAALRNLTLPSIPNLDIPPSPPGSPPAAMTNKVAQFLELKKQGVHFNAKLARSSAMKNPSLLGKLMTSAGLEPGEQYASTLSSNLWDPQGLPSWAFKDELGKAQQEAQKKREEDRAHLGRSAADFVRASKPDHSDGSAKSAARETGGSASDRVMTGLSRDRVRTDPRRDRDYRRRSRSPVRHRR